MSAPGRLGFTLVESLVALVLSSVVILLVSTTFLVQNRYQARQVALAGVHDNARAATELIARELRSSMDSGIVVAGGRTLVVRSPVAVGSVCSRQGMVVDVHLDGGMDAIDPGAVAGVALRDASSGSWRYANSAWSFFNGGGAGSRVRCAGNGADTVGAAGSFRQIRRLNLLFSPADVPSVGDLLMLFRETRFTVEPSALDTSALGLFRRPWGEPRVEFVTGIDTTAGFRYRVGGTYQDTVPAGSLDQIDAVRIVLDARRRSDAGGGDVVRFGLATNVVLVNAP